MAEVVDVAPELAAKIDRLYTDALKNDKTIVRLGTKLQKQPLSASEIRTLSERLGKHASDALREVLTPEALPDGLVYWNIAERTIKPLLEKVYATENAVQTASQMLTDKAAGINIAISKGVNPADRINEVLNFAVNSTTGEQISNALNDPVKTTALDFMDDFIKANANIRNGLGFKQTVIREYDGVGLGRGTRPCNWCIGRAGTWTYQQAIDNGVFERHVGCGCTIEVVSSDDVINEEVNTTTDIPF